MSWDFMNKGAWVTCCHDGCSARFFLPEGLFKSAKEYRGHNGVCFYCPYGHGQFFVAGETEAEKLRRELDATRENLKWTQERLTATRSDRDHEQRRRRAVAGQLTRVKKRVSNGVCPCCTRTFTNMARHMKTKHPEFIAEAAE